MHKFLIIAIFLAVVVAFGFYYREFLLPPELQTVPETGNTVEIELRAIKDEWRFDPKEFEVSVGDRVILNIYNEDDYDHGLAIEAFGINKRMPPNSWTRLEFVANRTGEFPFYCSVSCGSGLVNGEKRSHFQMVGEMTVK